MKNIILTVLAVALNSIYLVAQPVITGTGIIPQIGDYIEIIYVNPETVNIDGIGEYDQKVWDFSGAILNDAEEPIVISYLSPEGTMYETSNPDANIVEVISTPYRINYAIVDNYSFSLKSSYSNTDTTFYLNDSVLRINFPLSLGQQLTNTYSGVYNGTMMTQADINIENGNIVITADQYGTLISFNGSVYNNVTRVKVTASQDHYFDLFGMPTFLYATNQTDYYWYHENFTGELFHFTELSDSSYAFFNNIVYHENNEIVDFNVDEAVQDVHLCNGATETDVLSSLSSTMTVSDLYEDEHTAFLNWSVIDFIEGQAGVYNAVATFQMPDGLSQPETPVELEINASVYILEPYYSEQNAEFCDSSNYIFNDSIITATGTYYFYGETYFGCDSVIVLNATVLPSPVWRYISYTPTNGFLDSEVYGQIIIEDSQQDVIYRVVCNGIAVSEDIIGNGEPIVLGNDFTAGFYEVWSESTNGCSTLQGSVLFENEATANKLKVVSIKYDIGTSFLSGETLLTLFKQETDANDSTYYVNMAESFTTENGFALFDVEVGATYYISSSIVNSDLAASYVANVFFWWALIFDEAYPIHITDLNNLFFTIEHQELLETVGTNVVSGAIINSETESKNIYEVENLAVLMVDAETNAVINITLTDESGFYEFLNVPDNSNIDFLVTTPEHPNWVPGNVSTIDNQSYTLNFIIDNQSIYPEDFTRIESVISKGFMLNVFPNPSSEFIEFNDLPTCSNVQIFDMSGKKVCEKQLTQGQRISVKNLCAGTYIVVVSNETGIATAKFIKR